VINDRSASIVNLLTYLLIRIPNAHCLVADDDGLEQSGVSATNIEF